MVRGSRRPVPCAFALAALLGFASAAAAQGTALVRLDSPMRYRANVDASAAALGMTWVAPGFNDATWSAGTYGVGYDTDPWVNANAMLRTVTPWAAYSIYSRATFQIADPAQVQGVFLGADYDDGFVAWINGVEVYRSPEMPAGTPAWNTRPSVEHESSNEPVPSYLPIRNLGAAALSALQPGTNVLAIAVWNTSPLSSDLVLVPELSINRTTRLARGPYLQRGTPTGVTVRWRTDVAEDTRLLWGTSPGALSASTGDPQLVSDHRIVLQGLQPETRYYYAFGSSSRLLGGGDAAHSFVTPPPPGSRKPVRAWVLGDSGTGNASAIAVREAYRNFAAGRHTDLWLMLGDNAYPEGEDISYQTKLFDIYPEFLRTSVLWPTPGNHDFGLADSATQRGPYFDIFDLPQTGEAGGLPSGTEAYYSFDWANIHFVVLDSMESPREPGGAMLTWLEQDLAATAQDWIIAYWHHPPYSKGSHNSDIEHWQVEMRENAVPILEAYGVDLVLAGHSHSYERSFLIDGHYGTSPTLAPGHVVDGGDGREYGSGAYRKPDLGPAAHQGAVYTVAGASGQITGGPLDHPAMFVSFNVLGSVVLDVEGSRLDSRYLDSTGQVIDHFTMFKGPLPPAAEFEATPIVGPAPLAVAFTDSSTNDPDTWAWDFQDDGTTDSAVPSPLHSYGPGVWSVRLSVSNTSGASTLAKPALVCAYRSAPGEITNLAIAADKSTMVWDRLTDATSYDVVRGDLTELRMRRGDYLATAKACVTENTLQPAWSDSGQPASGRALFYLVRGNDCAGRTGTFDTTNPRQAGTRDPALQLAADACECDPGDDADRDAYCSVRDNCPTATNPEQEDADGDASGDACDACTDRDHDGYGDPGYPATTCTLDNCPGIANPYQADLDHDGTGNACDACTDSDGDGFGNPGFAANTCPADNCPGTRNVSQADADDDGTGDVCDPCTDTDGDGYGDPGYVAMTCSLDNCPQSANPTQANADGDGAGDVCDPCPLDALDDADGDGRCGNVDNCPTVPNPAQGDSDGDGVGNLCDSCPSDPGNDADADGLCAGVDNCPDVANANQSDLDGDALGDACDPCTDTDRDGRGEPAAGFPPQTCGIDNCPGLPNPEQADLDADGRGDACDACPGDPGNDADADDICGDVDNCPLASNPAQADLDLDGAGDACDPCTDTDRDGFANPGFPASACALDNCPAVNNPSQANADGDALGDACDPCPTDASNDADADGRCGNVDNCPTTPNPSQADLDLDGAGDACDSCTDSDGDLRGDPGFPANTCAPDNCPTVSNPSQANFDGDATGDACDPCTDADGDGYGQPGYPANTCPTDNCPGVPNPGQLDGDEDGLGDECDDCHDMDGDGFGDDSVPGAVCALDNCPTIYNPMQNDADMDGPGDACDPCTDPDGDGRGNPGLAAQTCAEDNCPTVANEDQRDGDADATGDACDPCTDSDADGFGDPGFPGSSCALDNCPATPNPTQGDADGDATGDACDPCTDTDDDGFGNPIFPANTCPADNCPTSPNPTQANADGDALGDACDRCTDTDGDGFGDPGFAANSCAPDNCPGAPNAAQQDTDDDGAGDACDACPHDPANDVDGDGVCGDVDNCPAVPNPGQEDADGNGIGDACQMCTDSDGDGFGDPDVGSNNCPDDNCPAVANPDQADADGDGVGDACDPCTDPDGDGFGSAGSSSCPLDNCPAIANPSQANSDGDGAGDACDPCTDGDQDGFGDPGHPNECVTDNCPLVPNPTQVDEDGDGLGAACDPCDDDPGNDADRDGVCGNVDNCPAVPNPGQGDADGDGTGDACDPCTDTDGDGRGNAGFPANACAPDNCPAVPNPSQADADADGLGDACDACPLDPANDADGDGSCAGQDNCPGVSNPSQSNVDGDALGDACDACPLDPANDADQDGRCANQDNCPAAANPTQADTDGDALGDACDACPLDPANDVDQDGRCADADNCPLIANPSQANADGDALGDACDACPLDSANDVDLDGRCANLDNCPVVPNPTQLDSDGDQAGDACDACPVDPYDDEDADGLCADADNCPRAANPGQADGDGDGIGDDCELVRVNGTAMIAATEVTNADYAAFLNAVAQSDPNGLYNVEMGIDLRAGISRSGLSGAYVYATRSNMDDKPVNYVSWVDAARYVNWLANGKPTGAQGPATTETGTYDLTSETAGATALRLPGAVWFLPTQAEWDAAAYSGSVPGTTWLYPTRSNVAPIRATTSNAAGGDVTNPGPNVANYNRGASWNGRSGNVTTVGGAGPLSVSPWGTHDQGGNVAEWVETQGSVGNRVVRGGAWNDNFQRLERTSLLDEPWAQEDSTIGFRVAGSLAASVFP